MTRQRPRCRAVAGSAGVRFPLALRLDWIADRTWRLVDPFTYWSDRLGRVRIPAGFVTDLISLPGVARLLFRPDGPELPAAIVHDFLYSTASRARWPAVTRLGADRVFLEAMAHLGVARWRRWIMYAGVRVGGRRAWRPEAGEGSPPGAGRYLSIDR